MHVLRDGQVVSGGVVFSSTLLGPALLLLLLCAARGWDLAGSEVQLFLEYTYMRLPLVPRLSFVSSVFFPGGRTIYSYAAPCVFQSRGYLGR